MPLAARCKDLSVAHEPICKAAIAFVFAYAPSRALLAGGRISGSEVSGGSPGPNRGPTGGTCAFFCFFVVEATSRLSLRP